MDNEEFDMLFLFLEFWSKSSRNVKNSENSEKRLFLCTFFDFCQTGKDNS